MKIVNISKKALLCISLLGLTVPCMANEIPQSGKHVQRVEQEEAIIVNIDQNYVTLQSVGDKDKISSIPFSNTGRLKVGDKVIVTGNTFKIKEDSGKTGPGGTSSEDKLPENGKKL